MTKRRGAYRRNGPGVVAEDRKAVQEFHAPTQEEVKRDEAKTPPDPNDWPALELEGMWERDE